MQCVVLAGGLGTRMRNIGGDLPKALLPVGQFPFIDWQLQWLKLLGITDVCLALGHRNEAIQNYIESAGRKKYFPKVIYSFDGSELQGTAGAIRNAKNDLDEDFLVTYGDSFLFLNAKDLFQCHIDSSKGATMAILKNDDLGDISNVIYQEGKEFFYDKKCRKPEMDHIDYGMMAIKKRYFLNAIPPAGPMDLSVFLTAACKEKQATPYLVKEMFEEIGSPAGYDRFKDRLMKCEYSLSKLAFEIESRR